MRIQQVPRSANMTDEELKENLSLQLAEIEMLTSMYPGNDEFKLLSPAAVSEFQDFIDGKTSSVQTSLDISFKIATESGAIDLEARLPHSYPSTPLEVTAITPVGCLAVSQAVEWTRTNFPEYRSKASGEAASTAEAEVRSFTRLWIVSHHIYNKNKRRLILECGTQGSLSGFCLPGKPGIICFEGPSSECLEAWSVIKNQTWQRIGLKHQEELLVTEGQSVDSLRKFHKFAELAFNTKQNASRDHHMDMGEFLKFLKERNCDDIFEILFGIETKQR
ncbi:RWD domain-containing protein 2A isoform X2 [Ixodes scapularis]|uniref:RWD domain-containing protein 2A isoform X2 n=1 Tax=Ixodes scapularis TaxID=6945 RepID=UPI001C38F70E|nr:RWD domain-containing protein 2A isoform X2 [Ixodes scapularis]